MELYTRFVYNNAHGVRTITAGVISQRQSASVLKTLERLLARRKGDVFLRADFTTLGSTSQVGTALRRLVDAGTLMRIGQGIYTRAEPSIIDGRPVPIKSLTPLMAEALARFGVKTGPTKLERDQLQGKSTQVPSGRLIGVDRPVRRKLGYHGVTMRFERVKAGQMPTN